MTSDDPLAVLSDDQRNELESILMEFDQAWAPERLDNFIARLGSEMSLSRCDVGVAELVKIDLQRQWAAGTGHRLEHYMARIPSLGSTDEIGTDLILAEFEARLAVDSAMDINDYRPRFPNQFERLRQLAKQQVAADIQASIDTSRIAGQRDTSVTPKKYETATELPIEFGRYRILRKLGAGAMGMVYLAHDRQLDRQVALKTPNFEGPDTADWVTRFYREARAAAKIHHRNICPVYDVGKIDGRHFISMAYVDGRRLSDFVKQDKLPPHQTSAVLVHRLSSALAEAHRHNVVHRDLKPANVMIDSKREPIVMDFGLARQMDVESRVTQSGLAVGTPAYMSPEQVRGDQDDVGPGADIYALGVIFYELLTGQLPFRGPIAKVVYRIVHEEPKSPSEIVPNLAPQLEAICNKMMVKDRNERIRSMEEVAMELKCYLKKTSLDRHVPIVGKPTGHLVSTESQVVQMNETAALNDFFADRSSSVPKRAGADAPTVDVVSHNVGPSSDSASGNVRSTWQFVALGFGGVLLLVAAIIVLTDGSRIKIPDGKKAVVETYADGSLKRLAIQSETKATMSKAAATPTVDAAKSTRAAENSSDDNRLNNDRATVGPDGKITINTGGDSRQLAVSPDGSRIVSTGADSPGRLTLWETNTGTQVAQFDDPDRPGQPTSQLAYSPDGQYILYCTGKLVRVVSANSGNEEATYEFPAPARLVVFPVRTYALAVYFERIAHRTELNQTPQRLRIWDWKTGTVLTDVPSPDPPVYFPSVSPDERFVTLGKEHHHLRYTLEFNDDELKLGTPTPYEQTSRVRGPVVFAPQGDYAATNLKNRECMAAILDSQTGRVINRLGMTNAEANNQGHIYGCDLAFTPDGKHVAMADHTGRAALWNVETGDLVSELGKFEKTGNHFPPTVVVSSDGKVIIGGHSADARITIQQLRIK